MSVYEGREQQVLRLRRAGNADCDALKAMIFGVLMEYGLPPDPAATDHDLDDIEGHYHRHGGLFDVLVGPEGELLGSVGLAPLAGNTGELRKMYLAAHARGWGWGQRLLRHALAGARERGYRRVVLETASVLHEAIALYEREGFRPYHPAHLAPRCDQAWYLDL